MENVTHDFVPNDPGQTVVRVGVDIGQRQDPTAIVVTEEVQRQEIKHYLVRSIERLPLGTPYPAVANRIVSVMTTLQRRAEPRRHGLPHRFSTELIIDGTGVGLPIVDLVRERGLWPRVALFTGSDKLTAHPNNVLHVGKGWMVSRLQMLLQSKRLHLPVTDEAIILTRELADYDISVSDKGHASYNARSGKHDDLVIALGLSVGMEVHAALAVSRDYRVPAPAVEPRAYWSQRMRRRSCRH